MGYGIAPATLVLSATALPVAAATEKGPAVMDHGTLVQTLVGLVAVVVLIIGIAWVLRQVFRLQPAMHGQMRVLGGLSLGPRERVVLIKVGETQLVVGTSPGRVQTLHVLDRPIPETPPDAAEADAGFAGHLAKALGRRRGGDR